MQISLTRPSDKDRPVRAAWGRGKVAWGGVGLSRVEYHGTDAQASLGRVGPVRAAWGRGKVAWGGVGLSRVEYHGTDAEASLTSGRRPSGVGGLLRRRRLQLLLLLDPAPNIPCDRGPVVHGGLLAEKQQLL